MWDRVYTYEGYVHEGVDNCPLYFVMPHLLPCAALGGRVGSRRRYGKIHSLSSRRLLCSGMCACGAIFV